MRLLPTCSLPTCSLPTCSLPTCSLPTCTLSHLAGECTDFEFADAFMLNSDRAAEITAAKSAKRAFKRGVPQQLASNSATALPTVYPCLLSDGPHVLESRIL